VATSFSDAITGLASLMDKLAAQIAEEENTLDSNFVKNLQNIYRDKSSFDLTNVPIASADTTEIVISDPAKVEAIIYTWMPAAGSELESIAESSRSIGSEAYEELVRDGSIGIGVSGPALSFSNLSYKLYELVKDLAWEVKLGAENLELAMSYLDDANQQAKEELDRLARIIEYGSSGVYPWGTGGNLGRMPQ
jgi:hypothetical protein